MKTIKVQNLLRMASLIMVFISLTAKAQESVTADPDAQYATELLKPGTMIPDFTLTTIDGKEFSIRDTRGKYLVLDFWASWCPDCRKDAPNIVRMFNTYKKKGVQFVGVSFDTGAKSWGAAVKKYGMKYIHVSELKKMRESAVAKAYGVKWIPSMMLIDPQGKVVLSTVVSEKLEKALEQVVNKK